MELGINEEAKLQEVLAFITMEEGRLCENLESYCLLPEAALGGGGAPSQIQGGWGFEGWGKGHVLPVAGVPSHLGKKPRRGPE